MICGDSIWHQEILHDDGDNNRNADDDKNHDEDDNDDDNNDDKNHDNDDNDDDDDNGHADDDDFHLSAASRTNMIPSVARV